jgi:hypothetical protein
MARLRGSIFGFLGLLALSVTPACASRYKVDAEGPTYAAQAKIAVKVNKTGIRQVRIEVLHLAPIAKINPANKVYMVWIAVPGQGVTKAGYLDYNERRRRGVLVATTPHAKFEVIVTIEQSPSAPQPSQVEIVRKLVSKI